ncbi:hypothetical protein BC567DRAFT_268211 [Phyllosticta citribraziliensis]
MSTMENTKEIITVFMASVPNSTDIQLFPVLYHGLKEPSTEDTKAPTMKSEAPTTKSETPTMENEMNMETDKAILDFYCFPKFPADTEEFPAAEMPDFASIKNTSDSNIFFFPLFPTDKKEQTRQGYQDEFEHLLDDLINGSFKPEVEVKFRAVHLEFGKPVDAEEAHRVFLFQRNKRPVAILALLSHHRPSSPTTVQMGAVGIVACVFFGLAVATSIGAMAKLFYDTIWKNRIESRDIDV